MANIDVRPTIGPRRGNKFPLFGNRSTANETMPPGTGKFGAGIPGFAVTAEGLPVDAVQPLADHRSPCPMQAILIQFDALANPSNDLVGRSRRQYCFTGFLHPALHCPNSHGIMRRG